MPDQELLETLRTLEHAPHSPEVRRDSAQLDRILHPSFREIGRSGTL